MSLSKKNKIILFVIITGLLIGFFVYNYAMKAPAKIETKEVVFDGFASDFMKKVQENAKNWQNKVVVLKGNITSKDDKGITLENQIYCQFREDVKFSTLKTNKNIILKGRVIGYDDLLEELKLDQCLLTP
ncbi:hypothetical protein [Polaribacter aquimarinus]|uniref:hypothetical protein n=1 Tax=Polaribacter aquimarinus TaxID=2100726 RepID=UPI0011B29171|nr:hypothetical protein [Polaribacter aquimarinus]